jgi:hypothetical protein
VTHLRVPEAVENPFRIHYRGLILGSALRVAEAETDRQQALGHRIRSRRAERTARRLRALTGLPVYALLPGPAIERFGGRLRAAVRLAWAVAVGLLLADVLVAGIHAWTTAAADLGVIVLTLLWFAVSVEDLAERRPSHRQLGLFD